MLWFAYFFLWCLYVGLTLLYAVARPAATADSVTWPLLPVPPLMPAPATLCQQHADCPGTHVCLGGTCVRKLLRGGKCDPATGQWLLLHADQFAVCHCLDDRVYDQKFFGGDCTVLVACGVHGRYDPATRTCDCDPGYVATAADLTCRKQPVLLLQAATAEPCGPDQVDVTQQPEAFHPDYLARLQGVRCVQRPCSFDALTGRPLKHTRLEPRWGCVCDPRYGLFGVTFEDDGGRYLSTPGFDACASILKVDPEHPMPAVEHVTYFYLGDREPISLIVWRQISKHHHLVPLLDQQQRPGGVGVMVTQTRWRHDYAQTFFRNHPRFRARSRRLVRTSAFFWNSALINEHVYESSFRPAHCDTLRRPPSEFETYDLLYGNPVCLVAHRDRHAHPMFREKVVLNPHHLTLDAFGHLPRYNAFVLRWDAEERRWTLDLDYAFQVDVYRGFKTLAPDYDQPPPSFP